MAEERTAVPEGSRQGGPSDGLEVSAIEGVLPASPLIRMALGTWVQRESEIRGSTTPGKETKSVSS